MDGSYACTSGEEKYVYKRPRHHKHAAALARGGSRSQVRTQIQNGDEDRSSVELANSSALSHRCGGHGPRCAAAVGAALLSLDAELFSPCRRRVLLARLAFFCSLGGRGAAAAGK